MTWLLWLRDHWFDTLQTLAILSGFVFTCITLRRDERSRRVANLFQLTAHHRDLWQLVFTQPELLRILSPRLDLDRKPVTDHEARFIGLLVLHLGSAHQAIKRRMMDAPEGLDADIREFFSYPIPRAVWKNLRKFQDRDFVAFVEQHFI